MTIQTNKRYICLSAESMFCALHNKDGCYVRDGKAPFSKSWFHLRCVCSCWQTVVYLTSLDQKPSTRKLQISHAYASCSSKFAADINHIFLGETITATPALRLWFWHQSDTQCQEVFGMAIAFWQSLPRHYTSSSSMNIFSISAVNVNKELHYRPGILGRSAGPTRSRLHLRVTS